MKKAWISLLVAVSLLTGLLAACGPKNTGTTAERQAPKGRYTETDIKLPGEEGEVIQDIIQTGAGKLEAYTLKNLETKRYTYENGVWTQEDKTFLEGIKFPYGYHIIYGEDKNRYVLYADGEEYQTHMLRLPEGGEKEAVLEAPLSVKNQNGYYVTPDFAAVTTEGHVILSIRDSANVYNQSGELLYSMPQSGSQSNWKNNGFLSENMFLTNGDNAFLLYNLTENPGGIAEEISFQQASADNYAVTAPDGSGGLFIANSQGIHHRSQGGSLWETVADGSLNSLSLPSMNLQKLFVGDSDDFYIWMNASETNVIKYYTYDPDMPSVPSRTLTVYGLDLSGSDTIRQAASMFQLANPDVKVELIDGKSSAGSTTVSDTIRALNTELLGGNGADVLILDGLPVSSYIEKGVLKDMGDILSGTSGEDELMENILAAFRGQTGEVYQIPSRVNLLLAYGEQEAIASLHSLEAMRTYQSDSHNLPLRPKARYEMLLRQLLFLHYDEIIESDSGKLKPGKVKELLDTVELLGKANGAKSAFDESEDGGRGFVYGLTDGEEGLIGNDYDSLDSGDCSLALEKIGGLYNLVFPLAVADQHGLSMVSAEKIFLPSNLLGINAKSRQNELAEAFVLFVLGKEVQENDLSDGLPVNIPAWDKWVLSSDAKSGYTYMVSSASDDYALSAGWPSKEAVLHLFELAKQADRAVMVDHVLLEIMIDETKEYFEGSLSAEQAAQNVENKFNLYFSEK